MNQMVPYNYGGGGFGNVGDDSFPGEDDQLLALLSAGDSLLQAGDVDIVGDSPSSPLQFSFSPSHGGPRLVHKQTGQTFSMGAANKVRAVVNQAKQLHVQSQIAGLQQKNAMGLMQREYTRSNRIPAGFALTLEASGAGAVGTALVQATVPFRPRRFVIPPQIAAGFLITSMVIGQQLQILGPTPIPAAAILPDAVGDDWQLPTVQTSQNIYIGFQNISGAIATVRGCCWGDAVT